MKPVILDFGSAKEAFLVRLDELREIQKACDAGPFDIAHRLATAVNVLRLNREATKLELAVLGLGSCRVDDVREPIFQGLVAAGMPPIMAGKLVKRWIDDRGFSGLIENVELALSLVVAGIEEEEPLGESSAAADASEIPTTTAG